VIGTNSLFLPLYLDFHFQIHLLTQEEPALPVVVAWRMYWIPFQLKKYRFPKTDLQFGGKGIFHMRATFSF